MSGGGGLMSKAGFKELRAWQNGKDLAVYIYQSKLLCCAVLHN